MAGGEGTRLRPLTCDCPKPMIRLMERPVMEYALALLKQHGITDIAVTLGYLPDAIRDCFGAGDDFSGARPSAKQSAVNPLNPCRINWRTLLRGMMMSASPILVAHKSLSTKFMDSGRVMV